MKETSTLAELKLGYLRQCQHNTLSTISQKRVMFNDFESLLAEKKMGFSLKKIDYSLMESFFSFLMDKGNSNRTIKNKINLLSSFFSWLERRGLLQNASWRSFRRNLKNTAADPLVITEQEEHALLDISESEITPDELDIRDSFVFGMHTGLRRSDIERLRFSDIKTDERSGTVYVSIVSKKDGDVINVPLDEVALSILKKRAGLPSSRIFALLRIDDRSSKLYRRLAKMAGLNRGYVKVVFHGGERRAKSGPVWKHVSSHVARHTFASRWISKGGSVFSLQKILGHSSIGTTMRYATISSDQIFDDFKKLNEQKDY